MPSVADIVKFVVPTEFGVPLIMPAALILKPKGREPLKEYGAVPPDAEIG